MTPRGALAVAVALAAAGCEQPPGGGLAATWTMRAALAGGGRLEAGVVALDGHVYVIGGFDGTGAVVPRVEAYDPGTNSWGTRAPLPRALHHVNVAALGGRIYVLGGLATDAFTAVGDSFVYDPAADAWTPVAGLPVGTERGAAAVAVLDGLIYLAGGSRVIVVDDVSRYDPVADTWTALPALPSPRYHAASAAAGGRIWVVGGLADLVQFTPFADVLSLTPGHGAAAAWMAHAPMPTPRGGCAAGVIAGELVCAGGEDDGPAVLAVTEAYDLAADRWRVLPGMGVPRAGTAGAVVDDVLYVPGGARILRQFPTDVVESLTLR